MDGRLVYSTACAVNFVPLVGILLYSILLLIERRELYYDYTREYYPKKCWGQGLVRFNGGLAVKTGIIMTQAVSVLCIGMLVEGIIPQTTTGASLAFLPVWGVAAGMVIGAGIGGYKTLRKIRLSQGLARPMRANLLFGCKLFGGAVAFMSGILWLAVTVHALQCNAAGRPHDQLIVQMGAPFQLSYLMIVAVPVGASAVWLVMIHMNKCFINV